MGRLSNRTVIVTGAAQGIGAAYAEALAKEGARLSVCDLQIPNATVSAIRRAGGEAIGNACDISDPAAVARMVQQTKDKFGTIDGLVNNAAMFATIKPKRFEEIDLRSSIGSCR